MADRFVSPGPLPSSEKSRITAVMLSIPPARFATLTSFSTASCGSADSSRISRIRPSGTMPVSPSVQSKSRSPAAASTSPSSTWTLWSTPSARVRMLRCGWVSASSWLISPSMTMRWTSV